ncbi:MAG: hypothetical protein K0R05_222 [Anaerocolumna sp.]|jgi:hypothetical protein|nr:hypothetical protein [Anaerocolumna sp.]
MFDPKETDEKIYLNEVQNKLDQALEQINNFIKSMNHSKG